MGETGICNKKYKSISNKTIFMSIAAKVELYVSKKPYIKEALAEDIVNYSALARKICEEENLESENAVKAALSRYQEFISERRIERRSEVQKILEETSLQVESGLKALKSQQFDKASVVSAKTRNGFTNISRGGEKSLVTLESPEKLENTPGVLEFILSSLSAESINVDHLISCREDTHLVVDEEDGPEVLEILQDRMG